MIELPTARFCPARERVGRRRVDHGLARIHLTGTVALGAGEFTEHDVDFSCGSFLTRKQESERGAKQVSAGSTLAEDVDRCFVKALVTSCVANAPDLPSWYPTAAEPEEAGEMYLSRILRILFVTLVESHQQVTAIDAGRPDRAVVERRVQKLLESGRDGVPPG